MENEIDKLSQHRIMLLKCVPFSKCGDVSGCAVKEYLKKDVARGFLMWCDRRSIRMDGLCKVRIWNAAIINGIIE
jgi:hypothetical protein